MTAKIARCAIYTRKSTEHNLDLGFNSLDAQREACEAYIKSQAHEGWRLIPTHYDDGGISGASLDRPALQVLLAEIQSSKIDVVVVYKVDRLTRSLTDFAKLVELFDSNKVSFVSITQSFNTTTSMGRLTLNVLLSFAQFEREVIGERVRDKIAASKRKGLWMGGPVPLGYMSVNKKLVIVPGEAETVRIIFRRYLDLGSIQALANDLENRGISTKKRLGPKGATGGVRFGGGALAHLLKNRAYIGELVHHQETHQADHEPILDRELFDAVQASLGASAVYRNVRLKGSQSLLTGRIFDDRGNRMSPSHTNKRGVRYRYYVSHAILQKRASEAGTVARVPATDIEDLVRNALRIYLPGVQADSDRVLINRHVTRVVVKPDVIEVYLRVDSTNDDAIGRENATTDEVVCPLIVPWAAPGASTAVKGIVHGPSAPMDLADHETRNSLLTAIVKARLWLEEILEERVKNCADIATREHISERYVRMLLQLACISPELLNAIVGGNVPREITVTRLVAALPHSWPKQYHFK